MFIAHNMSPFSVVDSLGFRNLIRTLEPCYHHPIKNTLHRKSYPRPIPSHQTRSAKHQIRGRISDHYYIWLDFKGYKELYNNHSSLD
ncbi:hypothetical protein ACJMK2_005800 [Sinanodonta woodiana]|uniref:Uncharacterized protein n=1 Tax=Sinanodonta woodiana TaxID=1069815 RepID=A0ABD3VR80_SINWO